MIEPCGEKFLNHHHAPRHVRKRTSCTTSDCVYFAAYGGRRVDLFYTPSADALLLVPGTLKRTSNLKDNEQ